MPFPIHYPAIDAVVLAVIALLAALAFSAVRNRFKQRLLGTCFRTAGIRNDKLESVHLPDVPCDYLCKAEQILNGKFTVKLMQEVFCHRKKHVLTGKKDVVPLPV